MASRSGDRVIGYGVKVIREWNGTSADLSGVADMVRTKVKPWDEVIRIMTIEEQAHLLAKHFPADVIWEAFADHRYEGWIPEHVERAMTQATHVASPGVPQQQAPAPTPTPAAETQAATPGQTAPPTGGWGASRPTGEATDPLARPTGPDNTRESTAVDSTVPDGLPVDGIASAMSGGEEPTAQPGSWPPSTTTREEIVEAARRAVNDSE
tara:strand:- start:4392 stop:5021 length:630 start_codon:yes stop_codon:yes gene_type:complete